MNSRAQIYNFLLADILQCCTTSTRDNKKRQHLSEDRPKDSKLCNHVVYAPNISAVYVACVSLLRT